MEQVSLVAFALLALGPEVMVMALLVFNDMAAFWLLLQY